MLCMHRAGVGNGSDSAAQYITHKNFWSWFVDDSQVVILESQKYRSTDVVVTSCLISLTAALCFGSQCQSVSLSMRLLKGLHISESRGTHLAR